MILLPLLLQAAPAAAPWATRTRQDATTGASSISSGAVSRERNARLSVRCDGGADPVVSVQYITRTALGKTDDRPVAITVDDKSAIEGTWEFPGDGTFTRDPALVTQLTVALATAKTIKVHATDLNNSAVDATFDGPPNDAAIKSVLAQCNYQFGVVPAVKAPAKPVDAPHL